MICTVIYDPLERENSIEIKRDCRVLRQSVPDLPEDILEYINKAKNPSVRAERHAAYTSLLCSLKLFFGVENPIIKRETSGKPIITSHDIFFSISHSSGLAGITVSDESEVGLDIQAETEPKREKALEERFLSGFEVSNQRVNSTFYLCKMVDGNLEFYETNLPYANGDTFLDKWVALESILKLSGEGFGKLSKVSGEAENAVTDIRKFKIESTEFSLANSIKNG